ncbi:MAG: DUF1570 domain-containing protein [Planctomycetia bacterium]|nr:DUF1570 domain-containing protein [Planctomycetia bacterium]
MRALIGTVCLALLLGSEVGRADILFYKLPGSGAEIVLQGSATINPGRTVTFRHPRFGSLFFGAAEARLVEAPTTQSLAQKKLGKSEGNADACLATATWALHHGLLSDFYKAASAAWKADPENATVKRLADMRRKMNSPLPQTAEQEERMRKTVTMNGDVVFLRSKHYLLMHNTGATLDKQLKKTRAQQRLELLEMVYESFLMEFCMKGFEVDVPKEPMLVALFADKQGYVNSDESTDEGKANSSGVYNRKTNIALFFDQGTSEMHQMLSKFSRDLQKDKEEAIRRHAANAKDVVRQASTLQLLIEVDRENDDIEVVSHEATHQMAANTGLMPNEAPLPIWAAEGMATYFESPKDAAWAGIGSVNESRLKWYRGLSSDQEHSNVDFIVSDELFRRAGNTYTTIHGYGQAWALTHFLMTHHFDKLMKYYQLIAKKKPEEMDSFDKIRGAFEEVFGKDTSRLNREWRSYMTSLKTDVELVLEKQ